MSRRNSREALMQDDLLKVAEVGIAMQRTDLAERQFAAGVAQTIFAIDQQKQTENAKTDVAFMVSAFDPDREDAPLQFAEIQSRANKLSPQEAQQLLAPAMASMASRQELVGQARQFGVDPVFTMQPDGSRRIDHQATRRSIFQKELEWAEEEKTWAPEVHTLQVQLREDPLFQQLPKDAQRSELRRQNNMLSGVQTALENNLLTTEELDSLYLNSGQFEGTVSSLTGSTTGGQPHFVGARMIDPMKYQSLVAPKLKQFEVAAQTREQLTARGDAQKGMVSEITRALQVVTERLKQYEGGELNLTAEEVAETKQEMRVLSKLNMQFTQGAASDTLAGTPGTIPDERVISRGQMSASVGDADAAKAKPVPLSKASANFPSALSSLPPGATYTGPDGTVFTITE
jgi:hypothetical protein